MRSGWISLALVTACVDASEPRTCEPVITLDEAHPIEARMIGMGPDGTSTCASIDTTSVARPRLVIDGPTSSSATSTFLLDLRDLHNTVIASGVDVTLGGVTFPEVTWAPAGGASYDVLVHIEPADPRVVSASALVGFQLTAAP
jgi:hypothetical protein